LNFHRELKLLIYLKALLEKPFQTFYYSLKNSIEKIRFQNTILFKPYASIFAKEIPTKGFISNKVAMPKACLN
jgi:hypothetical protein